jgi:hypothetical protein
MYDVGVISVHPKTKLIRERLIEAGASRYRAIFWEQQKDGGLVDILGQLVQDILELSRKRNDRAREEVLTLNAKEVSRFLEKILITDFTLD